MTDNKWEKIKHRLDDTRLILEKGFEPCLDEKSNILKSRAELLAKADETIKDNDIRCEAVEFLLAHEKYAIELIHIREVYPLREFTPVPCTPSFVLGIVNFRGQILSIIDLKKFFELPDRGITDLNRVIVLHSDEMEFGILADAVLGVCSIPLSEIQPSVSTLTGIREKYLKGVTKDRIIILDGEKILSDKNIVVHQEV